MARIKAPQVYRTRSGLPVQVRAATVYDERDVMRLFDKVSPEDRRFRFQRAVNRLGSEQLGPFTRIDHARDESLLAYDMTTGELIATGQLACDAKFETAEVAIAVRADRKGLGVGWLLLDRLCEEARERGVRRVVAIEDRANQAAIAVERDTGFVAEPAPDDPARVVLARELA